jgi:hypothetical protein
MRTLVWVVALVTAMSAPVVTEAQETAPGGNKPEGTVRASANSGGISLKSCGVQFHLDRNGTFQWKSRDGRRCGGGWWRMKGDSGACLQFASEPVRGVKPCSQFESKPPGECASETCVDVDKEKLEGLNQ